MHYNVIVRGSINSRMLEVQIMHTHGPYRKLNFFLSWFFWEKSIEACFCHVRKKNNKVIVSIYLTITIFINLELWVYISQFRFFSQIF